MKALSIKQPWASLIANGIKDIENRTWKTNYRGRIYIHATSVYDKRHREMSSLYTFEQFNSLSEKLKSKSISGTFIKSAIIGEVDIIDCVLNHNSIWAEQMATHKCEDTGINILNRGQKYVWNWVLANPVLYLHPYKNIKGKLSFWEFDKKEHILKLNA